MPYRHTVSPPRLNARCLGCLLCACGGYKESLEFEWLQAVNWATECPPIYRRYGQSSFLPLPISQTLGQPRHIDLGLDLIHGSVSTATLSRGDWPPPTLPRGPDWRSFAAAVEPPPTSPPRKVSRHPLLQIPGVRDDGHVACLKSALSARRSRPKVLSCCSSCATPHPEERALAFRIAGCTPIQPGQDFSGTIRP